MLISFSSIESGDFILLDMSLAPPREGNRRLTRTATLDGGAVITDGGVTHADRSFDFTSDSGTGSYSGGPMGNVSGSRPGAFILPGGCFLGVPAES